LNRILKICGIVNTASLKRPTNETPMCYDRVSCQVAPQITLLTALLTFVLQQVYPYAPQEQEIKGTAPSSLPPSDLVHSYDPVENLIKSMIPGDPVQREVIIF